MNLIDQILTGNSGERLFLLGNEAISRGLLEAGVKVATTYPGTPSSEIGDVLSQIAKRAGMYFEFSVNEKVAVEMAFSGSVSGLRSFVFMKHVGLNVASDSFMSTVYSGAKAGFVIMSADDPSMFSSQNEQDNREYSKLAHIPMIEPSNPQEAKDFLKTAYEVSEKFNIPVLFRTTTRVSHQRATVELSKIPDTSLTKGMFVYDKGDYVDLPSNSYFLKEKLVKKMQEIEKFSNTLDINKLVDNGASDVGVITSGEAYNTLMDSLNENDLRADIFKIGMTNPLPSSTLLNFLNTHERIVVVEELDDFLEERVRALVQENGLSKKIYGKMDGYFPYSHEYNSDIVSLGLSKILGFDFKIPQPMVEISDLPKRLPVLCPGCPHRATFYAVRRAVKMAKLDGVVYSSDIGCYSLGSYPPFEMADTMLAMGASVGVATGLAKATDQRIISFIGDSTFFHSGIPAIIDAVRNKSVMTLIVLDNRTTAMTGQQPNPGVPINGMGDSSYEESIENIVRALGVVNVVTVDPYDLKSTLLAVSSALRYEGISVVIAKRECAILRDNRMRKERTWKTFEIDQDKCTKCMRCVTTFSCPAIYVDKGSVKINPTLCDGCGVCAEAYVCPYRAIKEVVPVAD